MIEGQKILITGATGQVARPIADFFNLSNEVWCTARFTDPALKHEVEAQGIKTSAWTLGENNFNGLPDDFDYVIHSAASIFDVANDYDACLRANAEGTGLLMQHVRHAKAFMYVSSQQIYAAGNIDKLHLENEPLGCHPGYAPSYSIGKVASEAVVRTLCRIHSLPTIIARMGMAYGTAGHGGVPTQLFNQLRRGETLTVPPLGESTCALYYEEDFVASAEPLLRAASVPAEIVNWCGDELTDEREMVDYVVELMGITPSLIEQSGAGYRGGGGDITHRLKITGPSKVAWRDGIKRSLKARFPDYNFAL
jgi:UDP-glucuronate 4-epimerase